MPPRVQSSSEDEPSDPLSPVTSPPSTARRQSLVVRERSTPRQGSGSKRKRAGTTTGEGSNHRRRTADLDDDDDAGDNNDVYDPDQPVEERRRVQRGLRNLLKDLTDNTEEYLQSESLGLATTIEKANEYLKDVKRPGEATSDSRLLVGTTDLSYRKAVRLHQGSLSQGVDVDEFVSKCITYMRQGRGIQDDDAPELSSTQRQRRRRTTGGRDAAEDDDIGDEGDMMNWAHLGRFAVLPFLRRPALPGFLVGPLSVEKKVRKITKRTARFRPDDLTETRPEVLNVEDFAKKDNDLTAICGNILQQLQATESRVQNAVEDAIQAADTEDEDEMKRIMHNHGLRSTGGVDLMRFVVNPMSFGQTVENLFYVSFLIRDGRVKVEFDDEDLPSLSVMSQELEDDDEQVRRRGASKHQAILSMDMETWQEIIDMYELTEPMIENRRETATSGPGSKSWYT